MKVLVVEDDPMLGRAVVSGLERSGYAVDWLREGVEAEHALMEGSYDLTVLDLGLPGRHGLDILESLRKAHNEIPVLVMTARDSVADRVAGLDKGADDYLVKPFHLEELLARMRTVIRRRVGKSSPEIYYGALTLDPVRRCVSFRGAPVELSAKELAVLEVLIKAPGAVVPRKTLEHAVYGWAQEIDSNCLDVYLHHLRRKLDSGLIRNVRGVGYQLVRLE